MLASLRSRIPPLYDVPWCVPDWTSREVGIVLGAAAGRAPSEALPQQVADDVAAALGVRFGVPVNRGRTAIELGLRAMGIGAGDDVVVPAYVCRTAIEGVERSGARVVLADVGPDLHLTVDSVLAALTPATRCVVVPHLFGGTAPIDEIVAALADRGIVVLDDAAQSFGARRAGRLVGSFGRCGVVGVGAGKALCGAAGAVLVTDDAALAESARRITLPQEPRGVVVRRAVDFLVWRRWRRWALPTRPIVDRLRAPVDAPHTSAAFSPVDAAVAAAQLARLAETAATRRENARQFLAALGPAAGWNVTPIGPDSSALKLALVLPASGPSVSDAVRAFAAAGVETQPGYASCARTDDERRQVPVAEALAPRVLCIALEAPLPVRTRGRVADAVRRLAGTPAAAPRPVHTT